MGYYIYKPDTMNNYFAYRAACGAFNTNCAECKSCRGVPTTRLDLFVGHRPAILVDRNPTSSCPLIGAGWMVAKTRVGRGR